MSPLPKPKVPVSDSTSAPPLALTQLSDDERLFADSVYEFADREVAELIKLQIQSRFCLTERYGIPAVVIPL